MTNMNAIIGFAIPILVSVFGSVGVIYAFGGKLFERWFGHRLDSQIEQLRSDLRSVEQRERGRIENSSHRSRVQFDAEFKAFQEIWRSLARTRGLMLTVRPTVHTVPAEQSEQERLEAFFERRRNFGNAFEDLKLGTHACDGIFQLVYGNFTFKPKFRLYVPPNLIKDKIFNEKIIYRGREMSPPCSKYNT